MKKLMLSLYTASAIAVTSTSVISCIPASYAKGPVGQKVLLVTDGGNVNDKSFNEGSYNAIKKYANELEEWNDVKDISYDSTGNYVEASDHTASGLISGYKMAAFKETDAMVLSGFIHVGTIEKASKLMEGKSIVLADGLADYSNGKNQNVISIQFNSELAGFAAGYDASVWANQNLDKVDRHNKGKIAIGTFAGMSSKYSVDNYMWGLILGMEVFNLVHKEKIESKEYKEIVLANNYDSNEYQPISSTNVQGTTDARWFSQSFALGGATSSGILDRLITQNKADIIFPVAGPQISDVLSFSGGNYNPYIIGVDVDQVESFPSYEGRFITSAIKNLEQAITDELRRSKSLKTVIDKNNKLWEVNKKDIDLHEQSPVDDGMIAKPRSNWSVDTPGGKNLSKHTYVKYQEQQDLKALDLDELDDIATIIKQAFANAGENVNDYMQGQKIEQTALEIKKLYDKDQSWLRTADQDGFE